MKIAGRDTGRIGLGCMGMTWAYGAAERDEAESIATIHRALELGVTLLDTADMYGPFTNEELVGRAIAGRRDEVVLATKCGLVVEDEAEYVLRKDGRPEHVREAIDGSLRRLRTDFIDLYQLHRVDPEVPLEETWGAMAELVAAGKVGAIGLSEVSVPSWSARRRSTRWPASSPRARCGPATHSPTSSRGAPPTAPRSSRSRRWAAASSPARWRRRSSRPATSARTTRASSPRRWTPTSRSSRPSRPSRPATTRPPAQVALAWLLAQGDHIIPIPGTKRRSRLEENAAAAALVLTAEDLAELDAMPAPVGERY